LCLFTILLTTSVASSGDGQGQAEESASRRPQQLARVEPPDLTIRPVPDGQSAPLRRVFAKYVDVFGVGVLATQDVPDVKVLHCAHVLAQYLDNDEDGVPDNAAVIRNMSAGTVSSAPAPTGPKQIGSWLICFTGMQLLNIDGSKIHGNGVVPDVEVAPDPAQFAAGEDPELKAAARLQGQQTAR